MYICSGSPLIFFALVPFVLSLSKFTQQALFYLLVSEFPHNWRYIIAMPFCSIFPFLSEFLRIFNCTHKRTFILTLNLVFYDLAIQTSRNNHHTSNVCKDRACILRDSYTPRMEIIFSQIYHWEAASSSIWLKVWMAPPSEELLLVKG